MEPKKSRKRKLSREHVLDRDGKTDMALDETGYEADTEGADEDIQLNDQCVAEFTQLKVKHETSTESDDSSMEYTTPEDFGYDVLSCSDDTVEAMDTESDAQQLLSGVTD